MLSHKQILMVDRNIIIYICELVTRSWFACFPHLLLEHGADNIPVPTLDRTPSLRLINDLFVDYSHQVTDDSFLSVMISSTFIICLVMQLQPWSGNYRIKQLRRQTRRLRILAYSLSHIYVATLSMIMSSFQSLSSAPV